MQLLNEGGPFFMYPIVLIFIIIDVLFVKELLSKKVRRKRLNS